MSSVDKDRLSGALGGLMSPRPVRKTLVEEDEPTVLAHSKPESPVPKKASKTKSSEPDANMDVTVRLTRRQTHYLDRAVLELRLEREQTISRSEIVRALIDRFEGDAALRQKISDAI